MIITRWIDQLDCDLPRRKNERAEPIAIIGWTGACEFIEKVWNIPSARIVRPVPGPTWAIFRRAGPARISVSSGCAASYVALSSMRSTWFPLKFHVWRLRVIPRA